MNTRIAIVAIGLFMVTGSLIGIQHLQAQDPTSGSAQPKRNPAVRGLPTAPGQSATTGSKPELPGLSSHRFGGAGSAGFGMGMGTGAAGHPNSPSLRDVRQRIEVVKAQLQRASDDAGRKAAEKDLRKNLVQYFDSDMKARETELDAVKRRVTELEQLLTKRAEAKEQIIQLQLDTTVREASGLGFFRETPRGSRTSATATPGPGILRDPLLSF